MVMTHQRGGVFSVSLSLTYQMLYLGERFFPRCWPKIDIPLGFGKIVSTHSTTSHYIHHHYILLAPTLSFTAFCVHLNFIPDTYEFVYIINCVECMIFPHNCWFVTLCTTACVHTRLRTQKLYTGGGGVTYFNLRGGGITYFNLGGMGSKRFQSVTPPPIFSGIDLRELIHFYKFTSEFEVGKKN